MKKGIYDVRAGIGFHFTADGQKEWQEMKEREKIKREEEEKRERKEQEEKREERRRILNQRKENTEIENLFV